jgi:MoaA/NifB/PqqE/SkfB family radical SAM enzyme
MDKIQKPRTVPIELTTRCNEHCFHCYIPRQSTRRDMDSALLISIIDQCRNMGIEQITFSGWEPMPRPAFLQGVSKTNWNGLKLRIFSNLTMLNDDTLAALKPVHVHEIQASLYCAGELLEKRQPRIGFCV